MNLELYSVIAEMNGMGFPLAYLLLTTTSAITPGARTAMITRFLIELHNKGVKPTFTLTDKDSAHINAVRAVWPNSHIQLCFWHLKRAVKKHLASSKEPKKIRYRAREANTQFPFIDLTFFPAVSPRQPEQVQPNVSHVQLETPSDIDQDEDCDENTEDPNQSFPPPPPSQPRTRKAAFTFCPSEHREHIIDLMVKHFHQHPFIPMSDGKTTRKTKSTKPP